MKFIGQLILVLFVTAGMAGVVSAGAKDKKDHGAAVAGTYDGKAYIEIMQREMPLKLELKRTHRGDGLRASHGTEVQLSFGGSVRETGSERRQNGVQVEHFFYL